MSKSFPCSTDASVFENGDDNRSVLNLLTPPEWLLFYIVVNKYF